MLARPEGPAPGATPVIGTSASPKSQRVRKSAPKPVDDSEPTTLSFMSSIAARADPKLTPRPSRASRLSFGGASNAGTQRKRAGTAAEAFEKLNQYGSPRSVRTYSDFARDANESVEVVHRSEIPSDFDYGTDDAFEGLENVRACCGGSHDVGSLSRKSHSHSRSQ